MTGIEPTTLSSLSSLFLSWSFSSPPPSLVHVQYFDNNSVWQVCNFPVKIQISVLFMNCDLHVQDRSCTCNIISWFILTFWMVLAYGQTHDDVGNIFLFLCCIKQMDSIMPYVCSKITVWLDHRWCQNMARTSITLAKWILFHCFCSYHILVSSLIYIANYCKQTDDNMESVY